MFSVDYITLFKSVASDVALDPYTASYCVRRLRREGLTFWTCTLPRLSKAVLHSLELGYFERPEDFAWKRKSLRYFRRFLNGIFDANSGKILDEVDWSSVKKLRTLCEYTYKLALDFDDKSIEKAEQSFIETEQSLRDEPIDRNWCEVLRKDFETYYSGISNATTAEVYSSTGPRSAPGTFSGKSEYDRMPWYERKDADYSVPPEFTGLGGLTKPIHSAPCAAVNEDDPCYSEVLFVPKDSRGPRVIVREPYSLIRQQCGFNDWITKELERVSKYRINFQDQSINRRLALESSLTRENATLDLKEASDRVDSLICRLVFRNSPAMRFFVQTRTSLTKLPSGRLVSLRKLSGMGSGLTFPVMSLLIHLSICRSIVNRHRLPYRKVRKLIYVYGDDVIVPRRFVNAAIAGLERTKLKVNTSKSFSASFFRESCGGDYYNGKDVSPKRLKLGGCKLEVDNTSGFLHVSGRLALLQVERHCRELVRDHLLGTSDYLYKVIESRYGKLPDVSGESPAIGRYHLDTPDHYAVDENGTYKTYRAIIPVADLRETHRKNPWLYLASRLRSVSKEIFPGLFDVGQTSIEEVAVPRSIRYRRSRVSALRLMF